jgi:hypothetical protein
MEDTSFVTTYPSGTAAQYSCRYSDAIDCSCVSSNFLERKQSSNNEEDAMPSGPFGRRAASLSQRGREQITFFVAPNHDPPFPNQADGLPKIPMQHAHHQPCLRDSTVVHWRIRRPVLYHQPTTTPTWMASLTGPMSPTNE